MEWRKSAFDWNQARAFIATVEEGSLSAAARALGLTQPTLSRQVTGLEESLGITLFERSSRALLLTQSGTKLLEHFRNMGDAANQISIAATGQSHSLIGCVAISSTDIMATHFLTTILKSLHTKAPNLQVELITSNEASDLRRREADIAIRHTQPQDENLIAKRVRDFTAQLYASSSYIDEVGRPAQVSDIADMSFVGVEDPKLLLGALASRGLELTTANFNFGTSSGTLLLELIRQGFGVGFLPAEVGEKYPELENLFPELEPIKIQTWLVAHRELRTNPRVRLVYDLISDGLS